MKQEYMNSPITSGDFQQQAAERRDLLTDLADRREVLDYLITTFKGRHYELACILEHGFAAVDYENLKHFLGDDTEQTQSEMNADANASMDRQR